MMSKQFVASFVLIARLGMFVRTQSISPPPGTVQLMQVSGSGTNNYVCQNNVWSFYDNAGDLLQENDNSVKVGSFFTPNAAQNGWGIQFQINGSTVTFRSNSTASNGSYGTVPNVMYSNAYTTPGTLEKVTYGMGVNGSGGNAPTTPCNTGDISKQVFRQDYVFYVPTTSTGGGYNGVPTPSPSISFGGGYSNTGGVTNYNQFTGALLGVKPVVITNNPSQSQPWQVGNYAGSVSGTFSTLVEAIQSACCIQRDECSRIASDYGYQQGVKVQDCFGQFQQCVSSQATAA